MSDAPEQEQLPPYVIEGARSSRSKCKTCRRKINQGVLRIGMLIEGPYGTGYMWHHLTCAARRQLDKVEEAYGLEAWKEAKDPPTKLPGLDKLRELSEKADEKRKQRKEIPYVEIDPSGRARCKHCGEPMEKGSLRVVLGREVEFGNQVRTSPITVHVGCVAAELEADGCATSREGLREALLENSEGLPTDSIERVIAEIGA
jgi:hypothetical protein